MSTPTQHSHRPLWQWSATEIVAATSSGALSCREVTAAVVERMHAVNPRLNAITLDLGESALAHAADLDRRRTAGEVPGPLFGVPVTIKDNVDVKGQRTPNGVPGLAHLIAPDHSPVVKNLLDAGAVIVGRTNAPEFSMRATTNNPLYGLTLNPWDERISCGGSSGGAGSAVAAGMGAIGHGNDIGGSIRYPALQCGITGIKPSPGRVPAFLPSAAAERPMISSLMSVQGPLARTVADLRLALSVMAARDPRDPWWAPAPLEGPPTPKIVGVIEDIAGFDTAPAVRQGIRAAARALEQSGYIVEAIEDPGITRAGDLALRLLSTDMKQQILPAARRLGSKEINWYFDVWFDMVAPYSDMGEYVDALAARSTRVREWLLRLERHPVILMPQRTAPLLEVDQDLRSEAHLRQILRELLPSVCINVLGLPSALVPTGLIDGLPTGVQLVASRYREDVCLSAATAVEKQLGTLTGLLWHRT